MHVMHVMHVLHIMPFLRYSVSPVLRYFALRHSGTPALRPHAFPACSNIHSQNFQFTTLRNALM